MFDGRALCERITGFGFPFFLFQRMTAVVQIDRQRRVPSVHLRAGLAIGTRRIAQITTRPETMA
jgi:hypothetical protein